MPDRSSVLQTVADRHGVSVDAVRHLMRALEAGNGTMAQFNHPELGGFGQWSSGGMTMIGNMFDANLKSRVAAICSDLAQSLPPGGWNDGSTSANWWPAELGRPATSGSQNNMRYAYFPDSRLLAVETAGTLVLYDTGHYDISGVSQQQGDTQSLRFSGRNGYVDLESLQRVSVAPTPERSLEPKPFHPDPIAAPPRTEERPRPAPEPDFAQAGSPSGDVISTLERLSELHRKGVLTEAEFSSKKAELLARL
ncbi:SHOCT domain-containing protein [Methylobacterium sp. Leaf93]|uniref:SHOCT domain-containing protein n=1 Tax=Methylobacterium sp. Leaf93 TaxID=1736249 RepID=UPI0006FB7442|nr:SHOCT domain-containing protein [Methylobacterium sp. Leaf93]KQP09259.1 hypothetical protein ASF26_04285 [Methylobacterium sp. Leaf93]